MDWYSEQGAPEPGERFVAQIVERIERLEAHPDLGRILAEFDQPWLRELILPPFRIVYRRDEKAVAVVRVWRSERQMKPLPEA